MASSSLSGSNWTPRQNKLFEEALARHDRDTPDRWHNIAREVGGGKTAEEVRRHYESLEHDVRSIESGQVAIPNYRNTGGSRS
ncbi:protein RADIALIS-like 3 [Macadamia integrifolia]|uniref:protein RADIALIS-like 3 n=1 Tax=Macadamia integrifolia TaxID=60698 RepID=UPI001C4F7FB3|nr:protein RADIALIS-like 3 [Macadamia integrifolia]